MIFFKAIYIALFLFASSTALITRAFVEINGKSVVLLTNIIFRLFSLMHRFYNKNCAYKRISTFNF